LVSWSGNVLSAVLLGRLSGRRQPGGQHWHQCPALSTPIPHAVFDVTSSP